LTGQGPNTRVVVRASDGTVAWRGSLAKGQSKRLEVPGKATVKVLRGQGVRTKVNGNRAGTLDARGANSKATLGKKELCASADCGIGFDSIALGCIRFVPMCDRYKTRDGAEVAPPPVSAPTA